MDKVYVVIDIGCFECGVESEPVGIYPTRAEAEYKADERNKTTEYWRDGGQSAAQVFEMDYPGVSK